MVAEQAIRVIQEKTFFNGDKIDRDFVIGCNRSEIKKKSRMTPRYLVL